MSHAMNAEACKTLERLGYEWKSLDGRHWDWYRAADAVPDNLASAVRLLRDHNEWRRGNKTENWEPMPYSPAELGRAIDIVCDHATHTAQPDLLKQATEYARDIVTWLHRDHYADHITFEPFDDLLGLLSQIDNMICGWKEHSAQPVAVPDAELIEKIVEYGGHRENEGGSYATFQKSEARQHRSEADEVLAEIRALLATRQPSAQVPNDGGRDARLIAVWSWCRDTAADFSSGNARQQSRAKAYLSVAHHIKSKYFRGCSDAAMLAASKGGAE